MFQCDGRRHPGEGICSYFEDRAPESTAQQACQRGQATPNQEIGLGEGYLLEGVLLHFQHRGGQPVLLAQHVW
jgi:hypothetical protein